MQVVLILSSHTHEYAIDWRIVVAMLTALVRAEAE